MTDFERITLVVSLIGLLVNAVVFVAFVWQLRIMGREARQSATATLLDHDRRRKQATIDFYASTLEKRSQLRAVLPYDRDAEAIGRLIARVSDENDENGQIVTEYLSLFELLAAGVRTDIFDFEVFERIAGGRVIAIWQNYRPWIERRRELRGSQRLYEEIEWLAARVREHRMARAEASGAVS